MNFKRIVKRLMLSLLIVWALSIAALCQKSVDYIAAFPGGIVFLPTLNSHNVIIRYHNVLGGFKDAVFYPRGDTLIVMQLDTCKREYIALAWSYNVLEHRYIDSTYAAKVKTEQMIADNAKQVRRVRRKSWFRGFLWGVPVGIIGGVLMFVR